MHTTKIINSSEFTFTIENNEAFFEDIFPEFNEHDRIGVIVKDYCGAVGASVLILSAVTKFYDAHRSQLDSKEVKTRIYPEFFLFHVGECFGDHQQLDIWPSHREVIVEDNPEKILEAINDRAITRLVVKDISPNHSVDFLQETLNSAEHRIITTLAYSPTGRVRKADITAKSTLNVEKFVFNTLKESKNLNILSESTYQTLRKNRDSLIINNYIKETYKIISLKQALHMLT